MAHAGGVTMPPLAEPALECVPRPTKDEKPGAMIELSETYTTEEQKAVLRKIDLTILPMVRRAESQSC